MFGKSISKKYMRYTRVCDSQRVSLHKGTAFKLNDNEITAICIEINLDTKMLQINSDMQQPEQKMIHKTYINFCKDIMLVRQHHNF